MHRALFVDRDGTIIVDTHYPKDPDRVALLPGAASVLARARVAGFRVVVVSNQSGVARGLLTEADVWRVHERMASLLAAAGAQIDAAYYCMHGPDGSCECRKPRPGLFHRAAREHAIDLSRSVLVGDKLSDVEAGRAAGCMAVLMSAAGARAEGYHAVRSWTEIPAILPEG